MKYFPFILIVWLTTNCTTAQETKLEPMKAHYNDQATGKCLTLYPGESKEIQQIILIRHGEPEVLRKGWRGRKEAVKFARDYDSVGVLPFDSEIHCLDGVITDKVYHSNLPRSRHTAELLFGDHLKLIEEYRFREFERKVVKFINVRMPLGVWMGISRALWFMDLNNKDIETFKEAKVRANENALFLAEQAKKEGQVILVAHGLHNRFVIRYLRENGWENIREGGSKYLAVNIMARMPSQVSP